MKIASSATALVAYAAVTGVWQPGAQAIVISSRAAPIQVLSPVAHGTAPITLSRGKVVEHDLTMPADFTLAFDIQPTGTEQDWASIVHYSNGGNDSRMPGIWFWPGTTKLHVVVEWGGFRPFSMNPDYSLPLNQWSSVRVQVVGATAKITVNGRDFDYTGVLGSDSEILSASRGCDWNICGSLPATTSVTLYAADPWYPAARASIRAAAVLSDGTLCALDYNSRYGDYVSAPTCDACQNKATYWKLDSACGSKPPTWNDGNMCWLGTTCKNCKNKAKFWYGKAGTACGNEPKWPDGTICAVRTTCNACQHTATYWPGKVFTACGNEPCWEKGTVCGGGTTCKSCCNGSKGPWYWFGVRKCK